MPIKPNASDISVKEVIAEFEGEFAAIAHAVSNGEFALWVGSGISGQAPNLGGLIECALEHLRERTTDPGTASAFRPAFEEALGLAGVNLVDVGPLYKQPFPTWPMREEIVDKLWNKYSRLLDIRINGEVSDFMLWEAVNIRQAFALPEPPAATHLCIAILILEDAVQAIASANWDGFIETAVTRLSNDAPGVLQVVVDPDQMRSSVGKARLLKFHGCILYATNDPTTFRPYLTGSHTQITNWPNNPSFTAMKNAMIDIATNQKSLVLGLSIQDANLQGVFSKANQINPWPWPCTPEAPGHVFCEDEIRDGQRDVLKVVYGEAYNGDINGIEAGTHLRAWGEQVLIALVLKLLTDKLCCLMTMSLQSNPKKTVLVLGLEALLKEIRDYVAEQADADRTAFTNGAIALWSRLLSIFRTGALPANPEGYEVLSSSNPSNLPVDQNAQATGLGNLAVALALLQHGRSANLWELGPPQGNDTSEGAFTAKANWDGSSNRALFLVRSAGEAINLEQGGAFAKENTIVFHADDVWHRIKSPAGSARRSRAAPGRTGRMGTTHVCLGELLRHCNDMNELKKRFVTAVTI